MENMPSVAGVFISQTRDYKCTRIMKNWIARCKYLFDYHQRPQMSVLQFHFVHRLLLQLCAGVILSMKLENQTHINSELGLYGLHNKQFQVFQSVEKFLKVIQTPCGFPQYHEHAQWLLNVNI